MARAAAALAILLATWGCDGGGSASDAGSVVDAGKGAPDAAAVVDVTTGADVAASAGEVWCQPCTSPDDCGADARCIPDKSGATYCALTCLLSKNQCPAGSNCRPYGSQTDEFACQPDYGACRGGGEPCSPCAEDGDCQAGNVCRTSKIDKERSCFRSCEGPGGCPGDQSCEGGVCLPFVANKHRQVCNTGASGRCEPCKYDYDCAGGLLCGPKLGYCTEKCTKKPGLEDSCPLGLFCVDGYCQPPVAYKCQGWLGCAHGCPDGATCERGVCVGS